MVSGVASEEWGKKKRIGGQDEKAHLQRVSAAWIVPEKLRLRDRCDWSDVAVSLLPLEYGPSSEETAEGCRVAPVRHRRGDGVGKHSGRRLNKHDPLMARRDSCTYFKARGAKRGMGGGEGSQIGRAHV